MFGISNPPFVYFFQRKAISRVVYIFVTILVFLVQFSRYGHGKDSGRTDGRRTDIIDITYLTVKAGQL